MIETLTIEEIEARYPRQWVLLDHVRKKPGPQVLGGRVLFHSPNPDDVYEKASEVGLEKHLAIHRTGPFDPDQRYCL